MHRDPRLGNSGVPHAVGGCSFTGNDELQQRQPGRIRQRAKKNLAVVSTCVQAGSPDTMVPLPDRVILAPPWDLNYSRRRIVWFA